MLNFRSASIFMAILAFMVFLLMDARIEFLWIVLPLALIYIIILVIGSVRINSGFYLEAFCRGMTNEKVVALTFDDGPDEKYTPLILEILMKHQVMATFFVIGNKAEKQGDILQRIHSEGHALGNHSFSHAFFFDLFGREKMERDLLKADEIIIKVSGKKPEYFRPPYGVTNPVVAKVTKMLKYKVVGWSVRSLDTVLKDEDKILERIKDRLHPGAIILMHDDREVTSKVLEKVILMVKEEGYRFVGLEELI